MPSICLGPPGETQPGRVETIDGVTVHLTPGMEVKQGHGHIRVVLRRFLFWTWLELEGAKAVAVYGGQ